MQEELFYMTSRVNLTVINRKCSYFNNYNKTTDAWYGTPDLDGGMGMLQKQEVDIVTTLTGVNLFRSEYVDFPLPTRQLFINRQPFCCLLTIIQGCTKSRALD